MSALSLAELDERIVRLEREIERCRAFKRSKETTKAAANSLFRV